MPATKIDINCPTCRASYRVPTENAGRKVRCAKCGQKFRIPPMNRPATEEEIMRWLMEDPEDDVVPPPRRARVAAEAPATVSNPAAPPGEATREAKAPLHPPLTFRKTG